MARVLSDLEQKFLEVLGNEANCDLNVAKKLAGYSPTTNISSIVNQLQDEILALAKQMLARNSVKAALGLVDVLDNPQKIGSRDKMAAAEKILDRVGIVKQEVVEVKATGPTIVFLPAKKESELYD